MENRREFLKKLGLGSLVVAAGVSPIIASAVDKGIELNFNNPEQLLNQQINVFRWYGDNVLSKAYRTRNEAELHSLFDTDAEEYWFTEKYGGQIAQQVASMAYELAEKFDVKTWEAEKVGPYVKSRIGKVVEDKITLKNYLEEIERDFDGYWVSQK